MLTVNYVQYNAGSKFAFNVSVAEVNDIIVYYLPNDDVSILLVLKTCF